MSTKQKEQREPIISKQGVAMLPRPQKADKYQEFILWTAMPTVERVQLGIETQTEFAAYYNVNEATLWRWKNRPDFETRVDHLQSKWAVTKTSDVVMGIYRSAVKGNPMSQLLWLQYFKKFSPKSEVEHRAKVEISVNDIRFLIQGLPTKELRDEHYNNLRKLLDDAQDARNRGLLEDRDGPDGFEGEIQGDTDNNAQDVSDEDTDAVAGSYQKSIRADMVWEVSSHYNQGPAWRG